MVITGPLPPHLPVFDFAPTVSDVSVHCAGPSVSFPVPIRGRLIDMNARARPAPSYPVADENLRGLIA